MQQGIPEQPQVSAGGGAGMGGQPRSSPFTMPTQQQPSGGAGAGGIPEGNP